MNYKTTVPWSSDLHDALVFEWWPREIDLIVSCSYYNQRGYRGYMTFAARSAPTGDGGEGNTNTHKIYRLPRDTSPTSVWCVLCLVSVLDQRSLGVPSPLFDFSPW